MENHQEHLTSPPPPPPPMAPIIRLHHPYLNNSWSEGLLVPEIPPPEAEKGKETMISCNVWWTHSSSDCIHAKWMEEADKTRQTRPTRGAAQNAARNAAHSRSGLWNCKYKHVLQDPICLGTNLGVYPEVGCNYYKSFTMQKICRCLDVAVLNLYLVLRIRAQCTKSAEPEDSIKIMWVFLKETRTFFSAWKTLKWSRAKKMVAPNSKTKETTLSQWKHDVRLLCTFWSRGSSLRTCVSSISVHCVTVLSSRILSNLLSLFALFYILQAVVALKPFCALMALLFAGGI